MNNILVYNDSFFEISQTFVYYQIEALSGSYDVDLLSYKFENPHGFDIGEYNNIKISKPTNFIGKVTSKLYRLSTGSSLHLNLRSHLLLRNTFRKKDYKAIHAHFGYNGLNILQYAKSLNIPLVVTFHGHDASAMLSDKAYREQLPELFDYASGIILVSRHMIDTLEIEPWLDKVRIIPCSVDPSVFTKIDESGISDKIKIVHAGRIAKKKGVPDLIKVFSKLVKIFDNLELHIAGEGEEFEKCILLAEKLNITDQIVFYGAVSHCNLKKILKKGDIFVLNSRVADDGDMEGTPVTLLEAMCMGKAVVSTRHAGIPYVIEDGVNGLLADEKNNSQLQQCLSEFILSDNLRSRLGAEAEKTILQSHTVGKMKTQIDSLFSGIISNGYLTEVNSFSNSARHKSYESA